MAALADTGAAAADTGAAGSPGRELLLEQRVLAKNDELAGQIRRRLAARDVLAVNLMSSPGSGKTTLLERTVRDLAGRWPLAVVEGDQESVRDAERIRAAGVPVVQVNTGRGCHLDADMVDRALRALDPPAEAVVFVENVGNLVCPALFDLGESARVVLTSVTEGEDKPLKYPHMFAKADLILLTKCDLVPFLAVDLDHCVGLIRRINPAAHVLALSGLHRPADTAGVEPESGLAAWYAWLRARRDRPDARPRAGAAGRV
ncbi:hydrogenase-3 accessory protein for metallocenter assembly with P-loop containing NTP hydrolase domain [Frankia alni ACN14a]|uniref:Hydrogenase-3 accessory protein for metallocenter assembly with P-loop containing NTP hydrolase domain n=1 Tax=Frankia alni (strain DSM 45986 / CECT 9034 / ACN14a) TaxID=326424 RepID=Q0RN54_FRAAA|nr:hydrogenase-3 accessory protein for metallocenter assembly with P-loop containing NTP hydrolase domain [Frankia alni ACN14a]